jgi:hypothetical protein
MTQELFQFDEATHSYLFGEKRERVPSVTQILAGVGIVDYSAIPPEVLAKAADRGTRAHLACQFLMEGVLDWSTVADDIYGYVLGCERFLKESGFKPDVAMLEHQGVHTVGGMSYGYRWDACGKFNDFQTILDLKCTASVQKSWGIQTAAYDLAAYAIDKQVRKRFVLHLGKGGAYQVYEYRERRDYELFKWALGIETWKRREGKTDGNDYPIDLA